MRIVILETSGSYGEVAIADEHEVKEVRRLSAARKHARDLVPELQALLRSADWKPASIDLVLLDIGPGSYTGLRVGIMTAKAFAYATGAKIVARDAPTILAEAAPTGVTKIATMIDAQQGRIYATHFRRQDGKVSESGPTTIADAASWARTLEPGTFITGPAVSRFQSVLPENCLIAAPVEQEPSALGLWRAGIRAYRDGKLDDFWTLEPLYLRPSAAEEKWDQRNPPSL